MGQIKSFFAGLCCLALLFPLTSCGEETPAAPADGPEAQTARAPTEAVTQAPASDPAPSPEPAPSPAPAAEPGPEPKETVITLGVLTAPTGDLGFGWWTVNESDRLLRELTDDYATVTTDRGGKPVLNAAVCAGADEAKNDDGSKTVTFHLNKEIFYSNGDSVTAKDYLLYYWIARSVRESGEAEIPWLDYVTEPRFIDWRTFSVTIPAERVEGYYDLLNVSLQPLSPRLLGLTEYPGFLGDRLPYGGGQPVADWAYSDDTAIQRMRFLCAGRVSAGPYSLESFDAAEGTAVLRRNPYYAGNFEGVTPTVETVILRPTGQERVLDDLASGAVDAVEGLVDAELIAGVEAMDGVTAQLYSRSGYGKLIFQCDRGPTQFKAVRQALAWLFDADVYAERFCQGYGHAALAPGYPELWCYEGLEDELNDYAYNPERAVEILTADGWVLAEDGSGYVSGVRWKAVTPEEAAGWPDCVTLADGRVLMPLRLRYLVSMGSSVAEPSYDWFLGTDAVRDAGFEVTYDEAAGFSGFLSYLYRDEAEYRDYLGENRYVLYPLAQSFPVKLSLLGDYTLDPEKLAEGRNLSRSRSEALAEASEAMAAAEDEDALRDAYRSFAAAFNDYLPELPLYQNDYGAAVRESVTGVTVTAVFDLARAVVYARVG